LWLACGCVKLSGVDFFLYLSDGVAFPSLIPSGPAEEYNSPYLVGAWRFSQVPLSIIRLGQGVWSIQVCCLILTVTSNILLLIGRIALTIMSNPSSSNWKTNVNRMKTKRWVEAKSYSYDGDDWGDADEYGEYDEPEPAPKPTGLRKATAPTSVPSPAPVETNPQAGRDRNNSFSRGDERRVFSGPTRTAYSQPIDRPQELQRSEISPRMQPERPDPYQSTAQQSRPSMDGHGYPPRGYDGRTGSMTSNTSVPDMRQPKTLRKSSLGQADFSSPQNITPLITNIPPSSPNAGAQNKPATPTFIRPADIYRRMQEEKERERLSQESSRPSLDALTREESPAAKSDAERRPRKQALESVAERKSEYGMEGLLAAKNTGSTSQSRGPDGSPKLPEISGFEGFGQGFGDSFLGTVSSDTLESDSNGNSKKPLIQTKNVSDVSQPQAPTPSTSQPIDSSLQHQPSLGFRSVVHQAFDQPLAPSPSISSSMDRSNSDSTSAISPIISRNTSAVVRQEEMKTIPAIAEEPGDTSSRPGTSDATASQRSRPQARPVSSDSLTFRPGHRRNMSAPSGDNSPARTPTVEANRQLQQPMDVEVGVTSPTTATVDPQRTGRSQSPTKGRVRELVDKLDSADNSRRNSQSSLGEKVNLEQSQRPGIDTKESFRPVLPGGWSSYTTNLPPGQSSGSERGTPDPSNEQFAKAAAAGSALASALAIAAGSQGQEGHQSSEHAKAQNVTIHPETTRLTLPQTGLDQPSSIVPTPIDMRQDDSTPNYFAPVTPLGQRSRQTSKEIPQLKHVHNIEDMSTESSPNDLESDRLRKELVRELSPHIESFDENSRISQEPQSPTRAAGHESMFLPSEYDSYWNDNEGDASRKASHTDSFPVAPPISSAPNMQSQSQVEANPWINDPQVQPEKSRDIVPESGAALMAGHDLTHKFSWETPLREFNTAGSNTPTPSVPGASTPRPGPAQQDVAPPAPLKDSPHQRIPSQPININKQLPIPAATPEQPESSSFQMAPEEELQTGIPSDSTPQQESVSPQGLDSTAQLPSQPSTDTISPPSNQQKIPAFREIMAIKSTPDRIRAYDATREKFASMNTGLAQWIQSTIDTLPEHQELLRNGGSFGMVVRPLQATNAQNAPQASYTPAKPAFTPSSTSKITTQKGKELLHSAGIFGGKANNAAKGFFAKGKSKFRGGSDKVD
jgi:hypothetical protein